MSFTHQITSGRATLATEVVGRGDPVIFLHANVCDSRMWRAQLDGVGVGNTAIAYDRRGCGATRTEAEDFSAVTDLMAVMDATASGKPSILVGCSGGGRIALDAALQHPAAVRALVLIAPSVSGSPAPVYPPGVKELMARQAQAQAVGNLEEVEVIQARLWLDGPLAPEGRVTGEARRLFLDMNAIALRSPPVGRDLDATAAFPRLGEIAVPTLVISGSLDFPHIQERCRHVAGAVLNGSFHELADVAHLPSLERPADVTGLLAEFIHRCSVA